jgi:hypothetical protein
MIVAIRKSDDVFTILYYDSKGRLRRWYDFAEDVAIFSYFNTLQSWRDSEVSKDYDILHDDGEY